MTVSVFIAKLFAIIYLVVGIGFLINPDYYKKAIVDMLKNKGAMYVGGLMALVVAYLLVTFHNAWAMHWAVAITILGYAAFIKGILFLIAPEWFVDSTVKMFKRKGMITFMGAFAFILGAYFAYFGFVA